MITRYHNTPEEPMVEITEFMEPEDLSRVEDEDRIFVLDADGRSVELEVEDDVEND